MKILINSLHLETALLEACDWDEDELLKLQKKLSEYFAVCTKKDLDLVRVDLDLIFSENIADIVHSYLVETNKLLHKEQLGGEQ